jgi:hypothetical protein
MKIETLGHYLVSILMNIRILKVVVRISKSFGSSGDLYLCAIPHPASGIAYYESICGKDVGRPCREPI